MNCYLWRWAKIMVSCSVTTSTTLTKPKEEEIVKACLLFARRFHMENAYLYYAETNRLKIANCGIPLRDSVTMFQLNSTKFSAVSSAMKNKQMLLKKLKTSVQSSKSAVWCHLTTSTSICKRKWKCQESTSTSRTKNCGVLSSANAPETNFSKREWLKAFKHQSHLNFIHNTTNYSLVSRLSWADSWGRVCRNREETTSNPTPSDSMTESPPLSITAFYRFANPSKPIIAPLEQILNFIINAVELLSRKVWAKFSKNATKFEHNYRTRRIYSVSPFSLPSQQRSKYWKKWEKHKSIWTKATIYSLSLQCDASNILACCFQCGFSWESFLDRRFIIIKVYYTQFTHYRIKLFPIGGRDSSECWCSDKDTTKCLNSRRPCINYGSLMVEDYILDRPSKFKAKSCL
jgi:hypothetical protein